MTHNLATAIKPAAANPPTLSLIDGNARYWAHPTAIILRDLYEDCMQNDIWILIQLSVSEWRQNFDVASAWARRHFGRRLKRETLDGTRNVLLRRLPTDRPSDRPIDINRVQQPTADGAERGPAAGPAAGRRGKLVPHPPSSLIYLSFFFFLFFLSSSPFFLPPFHSPSPFSVLSLHPAPFPVRCSPQTPPKEKRVARVTELKMHFINSYFQFVLVNFIYHLMIVEYV